MTTDITKKETNLPTTNTGWGVQEITTRFFQPGKLRLYNFGTDEVKKEIRKAGEIVDSNSGDVIAGRGTGMNFVLCYFLKEWHDHCMAAGSKEYEFKGKTPDSTATLNYKNYEEWNNADGAWRRYEVNQLFVLPANQLTGIPYILTCKKSNLKHSTRLFSAIKASCTTLADNVYALDTVMERYEDHDYYVYSFKRGEKATKEQNAAAGEWYKKLSTLSKSALTETADVGDDRVPF